MALFKDLITPLIADIDRRPDLSQFYITIHNRKVLIGDFITAAVIFYLVVKPRNYLQERRASRASCASD